MGSILLVMNPDGGYRRIEPSPRYDGQTARLLGRAYAEPGRWHVELVRRPNPGPATRAWLRERGVFLGIVDEGGLTGWQRAYQRSLWWVHKGGAGSKANPAWSLEVKWAPAPSPGGHEVAIRVRPVAEGKAHAARQPARERWDRNPEVQSGGEGSPKQRFA